MATEATDASMMKDMGDRMVPYNSALRTSPWQEKLGSETKIKLGQEKGRVQVLLGRC